MPTNRVPSASVASASASLPSARARLLIAASLVAFGITARASADTWEVSYNGVDSAADNVPNYLRWDSAIDDDWTEPNDSFQLNTPSVGFMSVDRVTNPADSGKTGNIWIRDPILAHADGFTMEVGVELKANSEANAFSMTYLDDGGSFGVQLSPDSIKVGGLQPTDPGTTVTFNTTNAFHTYRMVELPNSHTVRLYVDNNTTPLVTGQGTTAFAVGSNDDLRYPRVLIGDNSNDPSINADYVLDFAQYHRGATAPGQTQAIFPARVLPTPPLPAVNETWTTGYSGTTGRPANSGWIQAGGEVWTPQSNGSTELNGTANARMDTVPGWNNETAVTIEARIRVMPGSQEQGFDLVANDNLGDTSLVLSPDKVQLEHAYSFVGQATVNMNTTDGFHIYRLTRDTDGLYWNLYIDNNPVASIADQHEGGNEIGFSRIWFGDVNFPIPANSPDVQIDYIRWHEGANAPPVPEPATTGLCALLALGISRRPRRSH